LLLDRQRIYGPDHPATLLGRHNLATWRAESGKLDEAIDLFTELLADSGFSVPIIPKL
jgi:hypothetical protein